MSVRYSVGVDISAMSSPDSRVVGGGDGYLVIPKQMFTFGFNRLSLPLSGWLGCQATVGLHRPHNLGESSAVGNQHSREVLSCGKPTFKGSLPLWETNILGESSFVRNQRLNQFHRERFSIQKRES